MNQFKWPRKKKKKTFFWSKLMGPNLLFLEITHPKHLPENKTKNTAISPQKPKYE